MTPDKLREESKENPFRYLHIGLIGPVGAGKTTLARILGKQWQVKPLEEDFGRNPFLEKFYKEPQSFSFQSQFWFLWKKIEQLKNFNHFSTRIIDPALEMDLLYAKTQAELGWMSKPEIKLYNKMARTLTEKYNIENPDLFIVANADPRILEERIRKRGRLYELRMLKEHPDYFRILARSVSQWTNSFIIRRLPMVIIDSHYYNFLDDTQIQEKITGQIEGKIAQLIIDQKRKHNLTLISPYKSSPVTTVDNLPELPASRRALRK